MIQIFREAEGVQVLADANRHGILFVFTGYGQGPGASAEFNKEPISSSDLHSTPAKAPPPAEFRIRDENAE